MLEGVRVDILELLIANYLKYSNNGYLVAFIQSDTVSAYSTSYLVFYRVTQLNGPNFDFQ